MNVSLCSAEILLSFIKYLQDQAPVLPVTLNKNEQVKKKKSMNEKLCKVAFLAQKKDDDILKSLKYRPASSRVDLLNLDHVD